jgi:hypothetical protein
MWMAEIPLSFKNSFARYLSVHEQTLLVHRLENSHSVKKIKSYLLEGLKLFQSPNIALTLVCLMQFLQILENFFFYLKISC